MTKQLSRAWLIACALMLAVVVLMASGCASGPLQPLRTGYATTSAVVDSTAVALQRGRITPAEARRVSESAKTAKVALDAATAALVGCTADPCPAYLAALQAVQPVLLQLEAELAKQQGAQK